MPNCGNGRTQKNGRSNVPVLTNIYSVRSLVLVSIYKHILKNNISWTISNAVNEEVLENIYPRLGNFSAHPEFSVIKDNNARTVLFLKQEKILHDSIFVKLYKERGLSEKAKHLVIPSKARSEWNALKHLDEKGLPCPKPLAYSEIRHFGLLKESCLLIEAIPSAVPLNEYLENMILAPAMKKNLFLSLACQIRDLHSNNIYYRDLHAGNILIQKKQDSGFKLFFIDLHRAAFPEIMADWMKVKDIAQFFNSISSSEEERFIFFKEYLGKKHERLDSFSNSVAEKRVRLRKTRLKSRSKRCLMNSSVFETRKTAKETYYGRKDFGKKTADEVLIRHAETRHKNGSVIKRSEKSVITVIERSGQAPLCVKESRFVNILYAVKNIFRKSRAVKSWIAANSLVVRGIDTPLPLAVIEKKAGPFVRKSFMISRFMKDAKEANDYIAVFKDPSQKNRKSDFIKAFAKTFRTLHDRNIYHGDLKSNNILIQNCGPAEWKFYFIDLDRVLFNKKLRFYQRANNLAQLNASISELMSVKDRLKFFYFYAKDTHLYANRKKYYRKILEISRTKKTDIYGIQFK